MPFKQENTDQMPPESQYKSYVQEGLQNRRIINRNILVINDQNEDRILTERAPIAIDMQDNVYFRDLIIYLREQNLIQPGSSIFFYDEQRKVFVHQGTEPITANTMIPLQKFNNEQITIKYRPIQQPYYRMNNPCENSNISQYRMPSQQYPSNMAQNSACYDTFFSSKQRSMFEGNFMRNNCQQYPQSYSQNTSVNNISNTSSNQANTMMGGEEEDNNFDISTKAIPREKRVKERKIGYVYDRVMEWRKYYETGFQNEQGRLIKVNLDVAASMVGLSRKTLDDYYKYIRKAETYNFDFKGRSEEKIGVLRNFVRDRQKRSNKIEDDDAQVDDDNRETQSRHDEAGEISNTTTTTTTAKAVVNQNELEIEDTRNPHLKNSSQSHLTTSNQVNNLPPPPPYSKEEENIYNKYKNQNVYQNSQEQEIRMRGMVANQVNKNNNNYNTSQNEQQRRDIPQGYEEEQYRNTNAYFNEEEYNHYNGGADASAQNAMEIEKCPQQQSSYNNYMPQFEYYENQLNNSFEMNGAELNLNKNPSINFGSFNNEYYQQMNMKQEYTNKSFENLNNTYGASPHDEEYCNFLNDENEMGQKLQED
ncbi:hypothetical protein ABPG72_019450 [Tetrahymena utriculariae]